MSSSWSLRRMDNKPDKLEILVARSAGFCFGVKRAIRLAQRASKKAGEEVYTLGPIIHNPQVVRELEKSGIKAKAGVDRIEGGVVIIRSHGITREEMEEAEKKGLTLVDATCPYVKRIHQIVEKLSEEGYQIVMVGDENHPEVKGILSHCRDMRKIKLVGSAPAAENMGAMEKVALVAQTTQSWENFLAVLEVLVGKASELRVFNTICHATSKRQREARELAKIVECMIVVGGFNSANTSRLTRMCRQLQPNTHQVETPEDIKYEWFEGVKRVGVTAGASTPRQMVEEVVNKITSLPDSLS